MRSTDREAQKKAIERQRVLDLRRIYPSFPRGEVLDSEAPDFLIDTESGVIGLELTGLYPAGGQRARSTEGAWKGVIDRARELYEAARLPAVQVIVHWQGRPLAPSRAADALPHALATTVARAASLAGRGAHIEYSGQHGVQLPKGVERLRVRVVDDPTQAFWSFGQGGVVPAWSPQSLQAIIDEKDRLIDSYLKKCRRAWLLLLADHDYASSWDEHSVSSLDHVYSTQFERVILYRTMPAEVTELRVRNQRPVE